MIWTENLEYQLEKKKREKNVVTSDCRQCEYSARTICRIRWHSDLLASHFGAGHPSFIRNVVPRYLMTLLPLPNWPWTDAITMNIENTNVKIVFIFTVLILMEAGFLQELMISISKFKRHFLFIKVVYNNFSLCILFVIDDWWVLSVKTLDVSFDK